MNVISIDIETTGLDCLHDDVIEFAVHNDVGTLARSCSVSLCPKNK